MSKLKLFAITIGLWLGSSLFIIFAIGFTAGMTADLPAARMGIPLFCLGTVGVFTVAADIFLLARLAQGIADDSLRRLWIAAFVVLETGTLAFLMLAALVVFNR
jgi:lysylphosphatidylglycerol synthetase-like protein (DUF2156 family)